MAVHCIICGVEGEGSRDFLCEECGDPKAIILACSRCRTGREISPRELDDLKPFFPFEVPTRPGIIVKVAGCPHCGQMEKGVQTEVYEIRGESLC